MKLTEKQIMALSDAKCEANKTGLVRLGRIWIADRINSSGHNNRTIQSLVDQGYLQLFVKGTCAHITDMGLLKLSDD